MENNFNLEILKAMYRAADELIQAGTIILPAAIKASEIVSRQKKGGLPFVWGEALPASGARDGYFVEIARARMDRDHYKDNEVICRECKDISESIVFHFTVESFRCSVPAASLFRIIRRFEQLAGVPSGKAKVFAPKQTERANIVFRVVITSAIRALVPFCSKDNLRPALTGICFDPVYGAAVATDTHKLQACPADMFVSNTDRVVVPAFVIRASKKNDVLTIDDKGNVYINDEKVSSVIDVPYVSWPVAFTYYSSDTIANCWQLGKEWDTVKKMVKSVSKAAPKVNHVVAVHLDGNKIKVSASDIDYDLHRSESVTLNIQDNGKAAVFGSSYDFLLMHKGVEKMYIGASSEPVVMSMKKGVIGIVTPFLLSDEEWAGAKVKLEQKHNDMKTAELLQYYGFTPGNVQDIKTANVEMPSSANVEMPSSANVEMPSSANVEMPSSANVEMPEPANVEMPSSANVEMPSSANVEMSEPAKIEVPISARVKDPSMDKVIYKIFAIAACYIVVLVMVVTAFGGNDKANASNGRILSNKAIERIITSCLDTLPKEQNKTAKTRLFGTKAKSISGARNTIATDTVTTDTITTDTMPTDTVTTDPIITDTITTDTVTTDTITTDTTTTAPVIPASPEDSMKDDTKEGSTPAALALISGVLPIIAPRKNDRKQNTNKSNINPSEVSDTKQMNMVKYSFSYALTLVDDFRDALHLLQDDPTGAQIVVETDIKDGKPGSAFSELNIYFLIQKSEWKQDTEEYIVTSYYTLSLCYVDADDSIIKPLQVYEGNYSLEDLKNIVCEIADNHYITCIYPDSL